MLAKRRGETPAIRYRTDRFYCSNSHWYFSTREGNEVGPFPTRAEAETALVSMFAQNQWVRDDSEKQPKL
jgi:hypothetical protein